MAQVFPRLWMMVPGRDLNARSIEFQARKWIYPGRHRREFLPSIPLCFLRFVCQNWSGRNFILTSIPSLVFSSFQCLFCFSRQADCSVLLFFFLSLELQRRRCELPRAQMPGVLYRRAINGAERPFGWRCAGRSHHPAASARNPVPVLHTTPSVRLTFARVRGIDTGRQKCRRWTSLADLSLLLFLPFRRPFLYLRNRLATTRTGLTGPSSSSYFSFVQMYANEIV